MSPIPPYVMSENPAPELRVTHKTIAVAAGVSRATVSKALRGDATIPESTTAHIREIATGLGYKPHPVVSTLMAQLRKIRSVDHASPIAFVTTSEKRHGWKASSSFSAYFQGAARRCVELGFKLETFWIGDVDGDCERLSTILQTRGVRGILVGGVATARMPLDLRWNHFATAAFGYRLKSPACDRATTHQFRNSLKMFRRLDELGYRRIGLAVGSRLDEGVINSYSASYSVYQNYIPKQLQIPRYKHLLVTKEHFIEWLKKYRPEAVVTNTGEVIEWCQELGLEVPKDVAVGFLGLNRRSSKSGRRAGIDQNSEEVGAAAIDLIVEKIYNNSWGLPDYPKITIIEGTWMDGWTIDTERPLSPSIDWFDFS